MSEVVADLVAKLGLSVNEGSFQRGDQLIGGLKKAAGAIAGFFAIKEIGHFIGETIEAGDKATKMAQKIGISAESVQELGYAAGQSGSDMDSLAGGLEKLSKGLKSDLAAGKGPALDALTELGIGSESVKGKMVGPGGLDDVLNVIADKFAAMPDGMNKTALSMELFGKSGAGLIPFLNAGSKGINELRAEANDLGIVLDAGTGKSLEALGDDWDRVKQGFAGVRNEIVTALLPYLRTAAESLVAGMKTVVAWMKDHREEIRGVFYAIGEAVSFAGKVIEGVVEAVIVVIRGIADVVKFVIDIVVGIAEAVAEAFDGLADLTGWLLDKLADFWDFMRKGALLAGRAFAWIKTQALDFANGVLSAGRSIVDFFVGMATTIRDGFFAAFDAIVEGAKKVGDAIADLPGIKQSIAAGKGLGGFLRDVSGKDDPLKADNFDDAQAMGYEGNEKDFAAGRTIAPRAGVRPPTAISTSSVSSTTTGPSTTIVQAPVTINAPGADRNEIIQITSDHVQETLDALVRTADDR